MGMTPQQFHTIPTSCAIFAKYALCLLLVVCTGELWKAVGWVVLGVECMLMCRGVCYVVGGCNVVAILSMADMVCLECRNC